MGRPTKEERAAAQAEKTWKAHVMDAAYDRVRVALQNAGLACGDLGGLTVTIPDPDGNANGYFVRLTETRQ